MKECVLKIPCTEKKKQVFENTSLSANMVAKYGNDLAGAIQCQLKEKCIYFVAYGVAMEDSAGVYDTAQRAVFIQGVNEGCRLMEVLPEVIRLKNRRW